MGCVGVVRVVCGVCGGGEAVCGGGEGSEAVCVFTKVSAHHNWPSAITSS